MIPHESPNTHPRRLNRFVRDLEAEAAEKRFSGDDQAELNMREKDEGDLFGIRAIEAGFFGGVAPVAADVRHRDSHPQQARLPCNGLQAVDVRAPRSPASRRHTAAPAPGSWLTRGPSPPRRAAHTTVRVSSASRTSPAPTPSSTPPRPSPDTRPQIAPPSRTALPRLLRPPASACPLTTTHQTLAAHTRRPHCAWRLHKLNSTAG